ncbi:hypothetical protein F4553_003050 [Allocatelliglobosispora scoriae]|uniref:Uncharacterized protein n=1 Tax=Allocatelliglobosispora scoriae TaxID=643052 RepID=A0A841BS83_9ACTN|nr:hypothetical protein [Allocatelliglobosispora scoriae]MBB5869671.1 hypothetical protein [Allocatelliglobosispora scoriae]
MTARTLAMTCDAQHCEDSRPCIGPADAVTIRAAAGDASTGCVLHGAVMLASLIGARVYPCRVNGAAIAVFELAQTLPPFAWRDQDTPERAARLFDQHTRGTR